MIRYGQLATKKPELIRQATLGPRSGMTDLLPLDSLAIAGHYNIDDRADSKSLIGGTAVQREFHRNELAGSGFGNRQQRDSVRLLAGSERCQLRR